MAKTKRENVTSGIGQDFFPKIFGGKRFVHCMIEILKNGRDYGARKISIISTDPSRIVIVDDGEGMGAENQAAFISVDRSTKRGSAMFGTGAKAFIFSHSNAFIIRTVSSESPDEVCVIECSTEELNNILRTAGELRPRYEPKTATNWPHRSKTGTEITFTLSDPKRKSILRGVQLAEALAARLPLKFGEILSVDGQPIPEKAIIGSLFQWTVIDSNLGEVSFEIYHPEQQKSADGEDALLLGSGEVGEIPIVDFKQSIGSALRSRIPATYFLTKDVCGFISVPFLRDYANEDRKSVSARIADEPLAVYLVDLLRKVEPEIRKCLKLEAVSKEVDHEEAIQSITSALREVYGQNIPSKSKSSEGQALEEEVEVEEGAARSPFSLRLGRREYAVGETIDVVLEVDEKLAGLHDLTKITWSATNGILKNLKVTGRGAKLVAGKAGSGKITADLPDTPHSASTNIIVVPKRRLRFARPCVTVTQGTSIMLRIRNTDMLKGDRLLLHASGRNSVSQEGVDRVAYTANIVETATITAVDSQDSQHTASCEITVLPPTTDVLVIRGQKFIVNGFSGVASQAQPTVAILPGDDLHQMYINPTNTHALSIRKTGDLRTFMAMSIGFAVAKFILAQCDSAEEEFSSSEFVQQILKMGNDIAMEILTGKPVGSNGA